jgi:hypothetical protein
MDQFDDPQYWRDRAQEAQRLADMMTTEPSKQIMLRIATEPSKQIMLRIAHDYERLAKRAEDNLRNATGGAAQLGERA